MLSQNMIITRSPLRITLGGGGTDLPSYYKSHGGFIISAAIDKYVYVTVMRPFKPGVFLKYSQLEKVTCVDEIKHPIMREALKLMDFNQLQIEITTLADIPSGTGLGSSGSFTTALLKALYAHQRRLLLPNDLARLACELEIDRLNRPVGKQDQYISAYGGITCFYFMSDEKVVYTPLKISSETLYDLEDNLVLYFTGFTRKAEDILDDQDKKSKIMDQAMLENLHNIKELGYRSQRALENGNTAEFGALLHEHWEIKKKRSQKLMSNSKIDEWYELGRKNGALGGKIVGAGGGGFLMFYSENSKHLRNAMNKVGLEEMRFRFDYEGTKILLS